MLVLAPASKPVVLLGDVGELEEEREGAQDVSLRRDGEPAHRFGELCRRPAAAADTPREEADPLLELEEVAPFLLDQHTPEQIPEQAHVGAERPLPSGRTAHGGYNLGVFSAETGVKTPSPNLTITSPRIGNWFFASVCCRLPGIRNGLAWFQFR